MWDRRIATLEKPPSAEESRVIISIPTGNSAPNEIPDWSFEFASGESGNVPAISAAVPTALESAKIALHQHLTGAAAASRHLQALIERAHADGLPIPNIVEAAGLSEEIVVRVIEGADLLDLLFPDRPQ